MYNPTKYRKSTDRRESTQTDIIQILLFNTEWKSEIKVAFSRIVTIMKHTNKVLNDFVNNICTQKSGSISHPLCYQVVCFSD